MPQVDYRVMPTLLQELRDGRPVALVALRRRFKAHRVPVPQRQADFNQKIRDTAARLEELGFDIDVQHDSICWHRPRQPSTARVLPLDERSWRTVRAVGDVVDWLADNVVDEGNEHDEQIGLLKTNVPRDTVEFMYGDAIEPVRGRAAALDLGPPSSFVIDRNGSLERYACAAIWDLQVVESGHGEYEPIDTMPSTMLAAEPRPPGKRFMGRPGRGRPPATDAFRAIHVLGGLLNSRSSESPDEDGTRCVPLRKAQLAANVSQDCVKEAAYALGASVEGDAIVVFSPQEAAAKTGGSVDISVALEALVMIHALDALSSRWTELLPGDVTASEVTTLRSALDQFLPHVRIPASSPTPRSEALFDARRRGALRQGDALVLRGGRWFALAQGT